MADEVVDIRRRIAEMRNEVSAAIVSNRDVAAASRAVGNHADVSFDQSTGKSANNAEGAASTSVTQNDTSTTNDSGLVSDETVAAYKGLDTAAKMPAFQLNVRNQTSNRLILAVIGIQVITNILLVILIWTKLR